MLGEIHRIRAIRKRDIKRPPQGGIVRMDTRYLVVKGASGKHWPTQSCRNSRNDNELSHIIWFLAGVK